MNIEELAQAVKEAEENARARRARLERMRPVFQRAASRAVDAEMKAQKLREQFRVECAKLYGLEDNG